MKITYDPAKRLKTLRERGIDFNDAVFALNNEALHFVDMRFDYGERRMICYTTLNGRAIVIVYVKRSDETHIISMRKANDREQKKFYSKNTLRQ